MGCLTSSSSSYSCSCVCVCAASRVHRHVQDVERADTEAQRDYLRHADDRYKTELHVHVGGVAGGFGEDQVRDLVSFLFFFWISRILDLDFPGTRRSQRCRTFTEPSSTT